MIKDTVAAITWLLLESNVTTYQIAKDLKLSTQFLDGYKNNPQKIIKMTMAKAQLLEEYALKLQG